MGWSARAVRWATPVIAVVMMVAGWTSPPAQAQAQEPVDGSTGPSAGRSFGTTDSTGSTGAAEMSSTSSVPPGEDPFYLPPTPLPGVPGDVIRERSAVFVLRARQGAVDNVVSRQVLYRSTSTSGVPIAVSGTVLVPSTPWTGPGERPLVAMAPGTRGVGDICAPSYTLTQGSDYEDTFIFGLLQRGWAVAVTDYEGLGTPGDHTYMVGRSEGHAVLDIARAAQRLDGTGLSPNGPVGIMGYSQGGGAAGWAAQLAPTYAPELQLRGVVAGGVPADLEATVRFVNGGPFVVFALLGGVGFNAAYPELNLDSYLNYRGRTLLAHKDTACVVNVGAIPIVLRTPFREISDFTTTNPLDVPAWQQRIAENDLGGQTPTAPMFLYHGAIDEIVPLGQAARLRRTWCDQGGNVRWTVWPGEHVLTFAEANKSAGDWLAARFAGQPAVANCAASDDAVTVDAATAAAGQAVWDQTTSAAAQPTAVTSVTSEPA